MPKGSNCFGSHATRMAINRSVAAENSGHVSGTVKHSQYECAVVERLEDDQVISVCANRVKFQTVKYFGGGFRFAAAATPFDFATQTVDHRTDTTCAIEDMPFSH